MGWPDGRHIAKSTRWLKRAGDGASSCGIPRRTCTIYEIRIRQRTMINGDEMERVSGERV